MAAIGAGIVGGPPWPGSSVTCGARGGLLALMPDVPFTLLSEEEFKRLGYREKRAYIVAVMEEQERRKVSKATPSWQRLFRPRKPK